MAQKIPLIALTWLLLCYSWLANAQLESITVTLHNMPEQRTLDGRIEAIVQASIAAQTQGRIDAIFVDIGDVVAKDAVLMSIISTEQRAGLAQAQANLSEAKSNLVVEAAEFLRINDLFAKDYLAKSEMDKATARQNAARAKVNNAEAALNVAKEQLSYTKVLAPFAGVVSARLVEPGELVQAGTLLISQYDPSALRVEVDLPNSIADSVGRLRIARVIPMSGNHTTEAIVPGKLILYPAVDVATNTVRARLALSRYANSEFSNQAFAGGQQANAFHPGQLVKVQFTVGQTQRLLIPITSVVYRTELSAVYVLFEGTLILRQIRCGAVFGNEIEVLAGLTSGEIIAIDPAVAALQLMNQQNTLDSGTPNKITERHFGR